MTDLLTKLAALVCIGVAIGLLACLNYLFFKDGKR